MPSSTTRTSLLAVTLLLLAGSAFAGSQHKELSVRIEGEDGAKISFSLSAGFVDGLLEGLDGSEIRCDATQDDDVREMLLHLSRRGEGSTFRFRDDDGGLVKARRHRGQLELDIDRDDDRDAHVSLPWSLAECMLGRPVELAGATRAELTIEDGGAIRVRIE